MKEETMVTEEEEEVAVTSEEEENDTQPPSLSSCYSDATVRDLETATVVAKMENGEMVVSPPSPPPPPPQDKRDDTQQEDRTTSEFVLSGREYARLPESEQSLYVRYSNRQADMKRRLGIAMEDEEKAKTSLLLASTWFEGMWAVYISRFPNDPVHVSGGYEKLASFPANPSAALLSDGDREMFESMPQRDFERSLSRARLDYTEALGDKHLTETALRKAREDVALQNLRMKSVVFF